MFALLMLDAAFAQPPQLALSAGAAMSRGESAYGSYVSSAPTTAVTINWHFGPFESWAGGSASLLMAGVEDRVVPSSLLQAEIALGIGGRYFGAGLYGGPGYPGAVAGLYSHLTVPAGRGWVRRFGVEGRLFALPATGSAGGALMLRVEPGPDRHRRSSPRVAAAPPPPPPDHPAPYAEPEPGDTHHEEPY